MVEALNDPDFPIRNEAVQALEKINTIEARAALAAHRRKQSAG